MTTPMSIAVFFTAWWVVLFAILPVGVKSQHESGEKLAAGSDPGAPVAPMMLRKAIWTTIAAAVIWAGIDALAIWTN